MTPTHDRPSGLADRLESALMKLDAVRDRPLIAAVAALVVVAMVGGGWWLGRPHAASPVELDIPMVSTTAVTADASTPPGPAEAEAEPVQQAPVIVHVAGQVARPGIVELDPADRVIDAVDAAGGPTSDADAHQLNLAAPVVDGMQIRVPAEGEAGEVVVPAGASGANDGGDSGGAGGPVNVNLAAAGELEALPGIGPALAAAIVDYRTEHGPFAAIADLEQVPGIGPAKLAALADHATL